MISLPSKCLQKRNKRRLLIKGLSLLKVFANKAETLKQQWKLLYRWSTEPSLPWLAYSLWPLILLACQSEPKLRSDLFNATVVCKDLQRSGALKGHLDNDKDGLSNKLEIFTYKTDPCNSDTDGDFLKDGFEIELIKKGLLKRRKPWGNAALDQDSDNNGVLDSQETWGSKTLFDLQK